MASTFSSSVPHTFFLPPSSLNILTLLWSLTPTVPYPPHPLGPFRLKPDFLPPPLPQSATAGQQVSAVSGEKLWTGPERPHGSQQGAWCICVCICTHAYVHANIQECVHACTVHMFVSLGLAFTQAQQKHSKVGLASLKKREWDVPLHSVQRMQVTLRLTQSTCAWLFSVGVVKMLPNYYNGYIIP